ncbi:hypothetical protein PHYSODRAFT_488541 [Phytophthora sojae]|uniref:Uncharacterized protein n=1 Tax=Phytophthora sojae (strain P6497) TaxID=1094619 RepID=G4Z690_PHYSP|nr:hypothetical protein PHYSODRAFT_488541 [Phytophthora sojae]EGZ21705.1 hypothetical protein PHYSODRAFT_488541 [Phytophthora sojae]|eukprot:XP_009524422.1 hypothetical protein PHYSODRAFT_488541 [Phytophthora sojae]
MIRHQNGLEFYAPADRGCAMCRNGENCSLAVHNQSSGVFCGDVLSTFQPCCCAFRNECMTTIFSGSCECFDGAREEEIMTTRFYLFVGLSLIAWALLAYDKMCAGPYKVMNSNHQLLASTPSAARARGEDSVVDTVDSDSDEEESARDQNAATAAAAAVATTAVAVEVAEEADADDDTTPLRAQASSPTEDATASDDVEAGAQSAEEVQTDTTRQGQDGASIQTV